MNLCEVLAWLVLGGMGSLYVLYKGLQNGQDITVGDAVMSVFLVAAGPITVVSILYLYTKHSNQVNSAFSSVLMKAPKKKRGKK
jgi:hypothetical protein